MVCCSSLLESMTIQHDVYLMTQYSRCFTSLNVPRSSISFQAETLFAFLCIIQGQTSALRRPQLCRAAHRLVLLLTSGILGHSLLHL